MCKHTCDVQLTWSVIATRGIEMSNREELSPQLLPLVNRAASNSRPPGGSIMSEHTNSFHQMVLLYSAPGLCFLDLKVSTGSYVMDLIQSAFRWIWQLSCAACMLATSQDQATKSTHASPMKT